MRRSLPAVAAAAAGALALLAGCNGPKPASGSDAWVEADPDLVRAAETVLASAPAAEEGWRVGVAIAENVDVWAVAVLTGAGATVVLQDSTNCNAKDGEHETDIFPLLIDPGDLITWSTEGDDDKLCIGEVEVLRKAAASRMDGDEVGTPAEQRRELTNDV